jgi:hypothetical protein
VEELGIDVGAGGGFTPRRDVQFQAFDEGGHQYQPFLSE